MLILSRTMNKDLFRHNCFHCGGSGKFYDKPCYKCGGDGKTAKERREDKLASMCEGCGCSTTNRIVCKCTHTSIVCCDCAGSVGKEELDRLFELCKDCEDERCRDEGFTYNEFYDYDENY